MNLRINGKDYEVSTNIGTAYDLEKKFGKKIPDIVASVEESDTDKVLNIFYVGFKRKNPDISENDFKELVLSDDNITYLSLIKELTIFCRLCMSIGSDEKEVRKSVDDLFNKKMDEMDEELENINVSDKNSKN